MINDQLLKRIFIPLAGITFPLQAGLLNIGERWLLQDAVTVLFFTGIALVGWHGVVKITARLHAAKSLQRSIFKKLFFQVAAGGAFASAGLFLSVLAWQKLVVKTDVDALRYTAIAGMLAGVVLTLLYEVIFLSNEKRLIDTVLEQLDKERQDAEMSVLKNELDPHFFFNCMNTLSYLVREDGQKAYQFVHKLSSVYKYFLLNKEKVVVTLKEELEFLANYVYLLRIRFDDNIRVDHAIEEQHTSFYVPPFSLQVLVENAIKHNCFSEKAPLVISILLNGQFIIVANPARQGAPADESTRVGLRNLKARYRLLSNQNIVIEKTAGNFLVKLPVLTKNIPT